MNSQPDRYVGDIFAILFACLVVYHAVKAFYSQNKINDLFVIGYIEKSDNAVHNFHITNTINHIDQELVRLQSDCVEALRALGMKKSEASKRMKQVFSTTPTIKTVQEFLLIALKK